MNLNAIIAAFGQHNWLVLVMLGALYARTLFSNKSRFPWSWAPNWLPLFSGLAGSVITVDAAMQGGASFGAAVVPGVLGLIGGGFADGLLAAIFASPANAPTWAKFLVGIIDDLEGGGPGGGSAAKPTPDPVTAAANALPKPPASARVGLAGLVLGALMLSGCTPPVVPPNVGPVVNGGLATPACAWTVYSTDTSKVPPDAWPQIALDLAAACGMDVVDFVNAFGASHPATQAAQANAAGIHAAATASRAKAGK